MIFVIIGIVLFVVCIIIYLRTDTSVLIRKDLTKPILLTIFSFEDNAVILDGKEYRLISIPRH